jgi:hypothetical protein
MFELCVLDVIVGFVLCLHCGPNRSQISFSVLPKARLKNLFDCATADIILPTPMAICSTTRVGLLRSNVLLSQTAFCQLPFTLMNWFRKRKRKNNYRYCRACYYQLHPRKKKPQTNFRHRQFRKGWRDSRDLPGPWFDRTVIGMFFIGSIATAVGLI